VSKTNPRERAIRLAGPALTSPRKTETTIFKLGVYSKNLIQEALKVRQSRARDDHGISTAMSLFGYAKKATAFVFTEFYEEVFALNLKLARLEYRIH
jgi:hypothetical protein